MTSDELFLAGVACGILGLTAGVCAVISWTGVYDRIMAARRRKADRGWVSLRG